MPWTGLEAVTRAKIIDEVNKLPLSPLQRPPEPDKTAALGDDLRALKSEAHAACQTNRPAGS